MISKGLMRLALAAVMVVSTSCGAAGNTSATIEFAARAQLFDVSQCERQAASDRGPLCEDGDFRLSGVTWNGMFQGYLTDVDLQTADGDNATLRGGNVMWRPERGVEDEVSCGGVLHPRTGRVAAAVPDPDLQPPARQLAAGDLGTITLTGARWVSVRDVPGCIEEVGGWEGSGGRLDGIAGTYVYLWDGTQHRLDLVPFG